jgi:hypothetical protein
MGRRLPRHTARKSTGERRLPDKTNNAHDSSEDGSEEVRGTAARGPPRPPAAGTCSRAATRQRQNERHEFECFFEKFGLTGRLTATEIEDGSSCMFLGLADQILDQQKIVPNTFCPITHADRKVKVIDSADPIVAEIEVRQCCALPQHSCKTFCPSLADVIGVEIEVRQRCALRQHSCKTRSPTGPI